YFKVSFGPARHEVIVARSDNRSSIVRCVWDRLRTHAAYPCSLSARWLLALALASCCCTRHLAVKPPCRRLTLSGKERFPSFDCAGFVPVLQRKRPKSNPQQKPQTFGANEE